MNKINIDNSSIKIDNNQTYLMEINKDIKTNIIVDKNIESKIVILSNGYNYDLVINLYGNSKLIINSLNNNVNSNIVVNLLEENADIIYNHSIVSNLDSINNFTINHLYKNTKSLINNSGINLENKKLYFNIDGVIMKDSINSLCDQHSKIINFSSGDSSIIPNLIIDNNDICANHSAYIGNFSIDDIFYIKSRGINEEEMYKLLYRSLLLGNMELDEEKELFNKILKEWRLYE